MLPHVCLNCTLQTKFNKRCTNRQKSTILDQSLEHDPKHVKMSLKCVTQDRIQVLQSSIILKQYSLCSSYGKLNKMSMFQNMTLNSKVQLTCCTDLTVMDTKNSSFRSDTQHILLFQQTINQVFRFKQSIPSLCIVHYPLRRQTVTLSLLRMPMSVFTLKSNIRSVLDFA